MGGGGPARCNERRENTRRDRRPTAHKSVAVKRQDAEKRVSGGEAEPELRAAWRGDVSGMRERDARARRGRGGGGGAGDRPGLI